MTQYPQGFLQSCYRIVLIVDQPHRERGIADAPYRIFKVYWEYDLLIIIAGKEVAFFHY